MGQAALCGRGQRAVREDSCQWEPGLGDWTKVHCIHDGSNFHPTRCVPVQLGKWREATTWHSMLLPGAHHTVRGTVHSRKRGPDPSPYVLTCNWP